MAILLSHQLNTKVYRTRMSVQLSLLCWDNEGEEAFYDTNITKYKALTSTYSNII